MKKSIGIFAILLVSTLLGAIALRNYFSMNNSQISTQEPIVTQTPTIQPTPQPTLEPTPTAPTTIVIPKPSILRVISPLNNVTYKTNAIELTYSVNSRVLWSYYALDSNNYVSVYNLLKPNGLISFKGNVTLSLSEGTHRIIVAVQTEESRFSSVPIAFQTIDFIVDLTP